MMRSGTLWKASLPDGRLCQHVLKVDETKQFTTWCDRRNDPNNSLIDLYGRWGTIETDGSVTLASTDFRITTESFPPVFAGTLEQNKQEGYYYPPGGVDLHWWYDEWPAEDSQLPPEVYQTDPIYSAHVGDYNGALGAVHCVYCTWSDNRLRSEGTRAGKFQPDIRAIRLSWP